MLRCISNSCLLHTDRDRPALMCAITQDLCVADKAGLSLINDINPAGSNSTWFRTFPSNQQTNSWASLRGFVSSFRTNTDQLSASLKTDKTGVWHWNSSQRIKDPFCLPPQAAMLRFHCDGTLEGERWEVLSNAGPRLRTDKQTCKCTKDTQTSGRIANGALKELSRRGSEGISSCGRLTGWSIYQSAVYTSCLSYKLLTLRGTRWHFGKYSFTFSLRARCRNRCHSDLYDKREAAAG